MFSATLRSGKMPRPSGNRRNPIATRRDTSSRSMRRPSNITSPARGGSRPITVFSVVVLPAPLWPRNARICPGSSANDTSEITVFAPYPAARSGQLQQHHSAPPK